MTGLAIAVGLAIAPYHVTIWDKVPNVAFMNDKVVAGGEITRISFYSRETGKLMSSQDAIPLIEDSISDNVNYLQIPLGFYYGVNGKMPGGYVLAAARDVKIAIQYLRDRELSQVMESFGVKYPSGQGAVSVGIAFIGKEQKKILLPPLPPEWAGLVSGYMPMGTDGQRIVGHVKHNSPPRVQTPVEIWQRTLSPNTGSNESQSPGLTGKAVYWDLSGETINLIHPQWATSSTAYAVDGDSVVGGAFIQGDCHALLWRIGGAATVLAKNAGALSVKGEMQVGHRFITLGYRKGSQAMRWKGTPESGLNLHAFLPREYFSSSAVRIGKGGVIYGTAEKRGSVVGVEWKPNPLYRN